MSQHDTQVDANFPAAATRYFHDWCDQHGKGWKPTPLDYFAVGVNWAKRHATSDQAQQSETFDQWLHRVQPAGCVSDMKRGWDACAAAQAQQAGVVVERWKFETRQAFLDYILAVKTENDEAIRETTQRACDLIDAHPSTPPAPAQPSPPPAQPAPVVPEGWKLVPVEPTEGMSLAGRSAWQGHHMAVYRAMLAAAPTPPAQQGEKS